jgi:hypothetical protein
MVIFNVGWVLKIASNTHQVSKLITMNIKNIQIMQILGPDIELQIWKKIKCLVLIYNGDFQVFSKRSNNLKLKIIKKMHTHPTLVILQKNPSLNKIFKSFHQFLSMYGGWLYCRRLPKTHKFSKVLVTLHRTLHIL